MKSKSPDAQTDLKSYLYPFLSAPTVRILAKKKSIFDYFLVVFLNVLRSLLSFFICLVLFNTTRLFF